MSNPILKQHVLEWLGSMKPQIVDIENCLDPLRHFNIKTGVVNKDPWIHKIRLPLNLATSQTRQQAIRLDQADASLRQSNSVAYPKRKLPANKIRIVKDRVETRPFMSVGLLSPCAKKNEPLKRK